MVLFVYLIKIKILFSAVQKMMKNFDYESLNSNIMKCLF